MSCTQIGFGGKVLPTCGVDNATLRWDQALQEFQCNPLVRTTEDGDLEVDRNAYLGSTDDSEHVLRGITSVIGDPDDILLTVFGHAMIENLSVIHLLRIWGGQYPSYYGYGMYGDQYHGLPYWGSYADDAAGPAHGTGSTIDMRGARFDSAVLMEQGFYIWRQDTNQYYWLRPTVDDFGDLDWDITGPLDYEPNAGP